MLLIDVAILLAFVLFGLLSWHFRVSSRISILAGLVLLAVAAVSVILGLEQRGLVATLAFYALTIGVALAIVERRWGEYRAAVGDSGKGPFISRMTGYFRRVIETLRQRLSR